MGHVGILGNMGEGEHLNQDTPHSLQVSPLSGLESACGGGGRRGSGRGAGRWLGFLRKLGLEIISTYLSIRQCPLLNRIRDIFK